MALRDNILAYWKLDDDGSGGVSLVDSTGNGNALTETIPIPLGSGIISGAADFTSASGNVLSTGSGFAPLDSGKSYSGWVYFNNTPTGYQIIFAQAGASDYQSINPFYLESNGTVSSIFTTSNGGWTNFLLTSIVPTSGTWNHFCTTFTGSEATLYWNGSPVASSAYSGSISEPDTNYFVLGNYPAYPFNPLDGRIDEVGVWNRALTSTEVTQLYNSGAGFTYPFVHLYYNNAENDGDWGNLLNWWKDSGFTIQATALPDNTTPVCSLADVAENTAGDGVCYCESAEFYSASFYSPLVLNTTGLVNFQGTGGVFDGTCTGGISFHDTCSLGENGVVQGDATFRDSSTNSYGTINGNAFFYESSYNYGQIDGNATVYYSGGDGSYPIGGTVTGSVTYLDWPAVSPQWFNDQVTGGTHNGDFNNKANWWTDNTYTTRPINAEGIQELPDASTNVFIAPDTGIYANIGDAILVNSIIANNGYISTITLTVSNGIVFSGNGSYGTSNSVIYADVTFSDSAYNDGSAIHGNANYTSSASLVESFNHNSLGSLTSGASSGSNAMTVNIAGEAGGGRMISRLLNLPWFINI